MLKLVEDIIRTLNARKKKKREITKTAVGNQNENRVTRSNQIIKPERVSKDDLIIPHKYQITPQSAKSVLRQADYIHIPTRKVCAPPGGDL
jgi:hypothetical protein